MTIANVTDLADVSDYQIAAMEGAIHLNGDPPSNAACEVTGNDRRQFVWALLERACEEIKYADFVEL